MEHQEPEPARADERAAITFQREVFPEAAAAEPLRGSARHGDSAPTADEKVPRQGCFDRPAARRFFPLTASVVLP